MSVVYYNYIKNPNFLTIEEPLIVYDSVNNKNITYQSIVTAVDTDMDVNDSNWSNLVTTYTIKNYIFTKLQELKNNNFQFDDYFLTNSSILSTGSGTVINDNFTNIFYPYNAEVVKFNTTETIKFQSEDINLTIDKGTNKTFSGFTKLDPIKQYEVFDNEYLEYPLTWLSDRTDIDINGERLSVRSGETVHYNVNNIDKDTPLSTIISSDSGTFDASFEDNVISIKNVSESVGTITRVKAVDDNIIENPTIIETNNSYYNPEDNTLNCYYGNYYLGQRTNLNYKQGKLEIIGPAQFLDENDIVYYKLNPHASLISYETMDFGQATDNFNIYFTIKISSDNTNFNIDYKQHILSFADVHIELSPRSSGFYIYVNNFNTTVVFDYDTEYDIDFEYNSGVSKLKVNGESIWQENRRKTFESSKFIIGKKDNYYGYYGEFILGKGGQEFFRLIGKNNPAVYWICNQTNQLVNQSETLNAIVENHWFTSGLVATPLFNPQNESWSMDFDVEIDKSECPRMVEILSTRDRFCMFQIIKKNDKLHITLNPEDLTNDVGDVLNENTRYKAIISLEEYENLVKQHIKVEFTGYSYRVFGGETGDILINEWYSKKPLRESEFYFTSLPSAKINTAKTYITFNDNIWWSFNDIGKNASYRYSNLRITSNGELDKYGIIPTTDNKTIVKYPFNHKTDNNEAFIYFKTNSNYTEDSIILSASLREFYGFEVYYKNESQQLCVRYGNSDSSWEHDEEINSLLADTEYLIKLVSNLDYDETSEKFISKIKVSLLNLQFDEIDSKTIEFEETRFCSCITLKNSSVNGQQYDLSQNIVNGVYWNFVRPNTMELYPVTLMDSAITSYKPATTDVMTGKVFLTSSHKLLSRTSEDDKIHIGYNISKTSGILYYDLLTKKYYDGTTSNNDKLVGGVYNYNSDSFNRYIMPKYVYPTEYAQIVVSPCKIYNDKEYIFNKNDDVISGNLYYQVGEDKLSNNGIYQLNKNTNDNIRVIGSDELSSVIDLNSLSLIKKSDFVDGQFKLNHWNESENTLTYYGNKPENNSVVILSGTDLKDEDTVQFTSAGTYEYNIDNKKSINIIASSLRKSYLLSGKKEFNNENSKLNSVKMVNSCIKSGNFNNLSDWELYCQHFSVFTDGHLYINNSEFTLSQNLFDVNTDTDEEVIISRVKKNELLLLTFTISKHTDGDLIVSDGNFSKTYNKVGTYSILYRANSDTPYIRFSSPENTYVRYELANISIISIDKIPNSDELSISDWTVLGTASDVNNGIALTRNASISQTLFLNKNTKYNGQIRLTGVSGTVNVKFNDEVVLTTTKEGVYDFSITGSDNNEISVVQASGSASVIEFISLKEASLIDDEYFEHAKNTWFEDVDGAVIKDNKLHVSTVLSKSVNSNIIAPNCKYRLTLNHNIIKGSYSVFVGSSIYAKKIGHFSEIGSETVNIDFFTFNYSDNRVYFVLDNNSEVEFTDLVLEPTNYLLDLVDIAYNWQIENDDNNIVLEDGQIVFNYTTSESKIYQQSNLLEEGKEYTLEIGAELSEGSLTIDFGGNICPTKVSSGVQRYSSVMGEGRYIKIYPTCLESDESDSGSGLKPGIASGYINYISLGLKLDKFSLIDNKDILDTNMNLGLREITLDFPEKKYIALDNKLIGLQVGNNTTGNTYTTGYLNCAEYKVENLTREKIFSKTNLGSTEVKLDSSDDVAFLQVNYIFIDRNGNTYVTTEIPYGKLKSEIDDNSLLWYNMVDRKYLILSSNEQVFLIGKAYTSELGVVFTENIQKERKLLSYTKPVIKNGQIVQGQGLLDISTLFFNGNSKDLGISRLPDGKYIMYCKNTKDVYPYNLDINELYIDTTHTNEAATWNTELNAFVSPYSLDVAVYEIHKSGSTIKYYSLTNKKDILESTQTYDRMSYKYPNKTVKVVTLTETLVKTIPEIRETTWSIGTEIYWLQ